MSFISGQEDVFCDSDVLMVSSHQSLMTSIYSKSNVLTVLEP